MNLTGSVLPSIFGRSCICSRLTSVIPPDRVLTEDVFLLVINRVLSISVNNESACALHLIIDDISDRSTSRNKENCLLIQEAFKTACKACVVFYHSLEFLDEVREIILVEILVEQIS